MELSFTVDGAHRIIESVVDCTRTNDETYDLTLEDETTTEVSGLLIGAIAERNPAHAKTPTETLAFKLATDGTLNTPIRPITRESSLDDEEWEYERGFDFTPPEVSPEDGQCTVRNVNRFWHENASIADDQVSPASAPPECGGYRLDDEVSEPHIYLASFDSAWVSGPLTGAVTRVSSYDTISNSSQPDNSLAPSEETAERVNWAFRDY